MTPADTAVAVELAQLRGELNTGIADIKGTLAVLVERTTRTDQDLARLRADTGRELAELRAGTDREMTELRAGTDRELGELRGQVEALKRARWPLPQLGALVGIGALAVAVIALFVS